MAPLQDDPNQREQTLSSGETGNPWGPWATLLMGLGVVLIFFAVDMAVVVAISRGLSLPEMAVVEEHGGFLLSMSTFANALVCTGLLLGLAKLRTARAGDYLGFRPVQKGVVLRFLGLALLAAAVIDIVTLLSGRPLVPEVMVDAYRNTEYRALYWAAVVLAAPWGEELLFRGFLFKGFLPSRLGGTGTILFTAFAWAAIHLQYDFFNLAVVFLLGLLLGYGRLVSRSIYVPLAMHTVLNLVATAEMVILLRLA